MNPSNFDFIGATNMKSPELKTYASSLPNSDGTFESFQLQMGLSFPFLRANNLRSSLLNIRARSFLLSCT